MVASSMTTFYKPFQYLSKTRYKAKTVEKIITRTTKMCGEVDASTSPDLDLSAALDVLFEAVEFADRS